MWVCSWRQFPSVSPCLRGEPIFPISGTARQRIFNKSLDDHRHLTPPALRCFCQTGAGRPDNYACSCTFRVCAPLSPHSSTHLLLHPPSRSASISASPRKCQTRCQLARQAPELAASSRSERQNLVPGVSRGSRRLPNTSPLQRATECLSRLMWRGSLTRVPGSKTRAPPRLPAHFPGAIIYLTNRNKRRILGLRSRFAMFTLADRSHFQDAKAREFLEKQRWPNGAVCPHCMPLAYKLKASPRARGLFAPASTSARIVKSNSRSP